MTWTLPDPMLAAPVASPDLPTGWAGEPKWDGWRAQFSVDQGRVVLRSRRGTDMAPGFPDVVAAAGQLPDATALDGELVVWEAGRLAFERLQGRLQRRGATAARLASEWPVHFVAFDVLRLAGTNTVAWPYRWRRAALEELFSEHQLAAPWALCPSTTDPDIAREWLTWSAVGLEGLVFKQLDTPYRPAARGWRKYKVLETQEAIVGAITGPLAAPRSLLLGRLDAAGHLQYTGRTTTLPQAAGRTLARLLAPASSEHPWAGWTFSAGWGTREQLKFHPVHPEVVVEFLADTAVDDGRYRHPVRFLRVREDLTVGQLPLFGA